MPDIQATTPIVVPPEPQKVFDLYGVEELRFSYPGLKGNLSCETVFRSALRDESGAMVAGPVGKNMSIPDLWELMPDNPKMAQAFGLIMEVLTEEAVKRGVI